MKKPSSLRKYLLEALPNLTADQDRLHIIARNGSLQCNLRAGFSFEMSYVLDITIYDYDGNIDDIGLTIFTWLALNQSETMANLDKSKQAITFEAEVLDNQKYDLSYQLNLSERVVVERQPDGKLLMSYPGEPELTQYGPNNYTQSTETGWTFDMPPTGKNP